ncbi:RAD52 motif-containing protein 1 [Cynoglossus semilaevis]|uniref:RAD52 motif-containing protein 1 n=1 Tax=Cynoglossus semilaevis TaxID=244447 RepID=UPI0004962BD2|nr:RAD52 motif-containing protein 1 [Cynoglossus semilaevis]XP_024920339.1 RAD52 motif-containing protein 1 [Cynoglossus semilaevis]
MDVEIVEFVVPKENDKTLFVWNMRSSLSEIQIHNNVWSVFSSFGPLYLVKVTSDLELHPPGHMAVVKFYSAVQAAEAQRCTHGHPLLHSPQLKVKLGSQQASRVQSMSNRPLSPAHCRNLANHYLGFNGWTSDIITLKELTDQDGDQEEGGVSTSRLRIGCILQLSFPKHSQTTRGGAVVEESLSSTGAETLPQLRSRLLKRVTDKALGHAFANVLLILLGNGKLAVEMKQSSDQFQQEQIVGALQVNCFDLDEEQNDDDGWDLTVP